MEKSMEEHKNDLRKIFAKAAPSKTKDSLAFMEIIEETALTGGLGVVSDTSKIHIQVTEGQVWRHITINDETIGDPILIDASSGLLK